MKSTKYEGEYMRMLSSLRSRTAADQNIDTLKRIRASNRLDFSAKNKIDEAIRKWGDKRAAKKALKELVYDLNSEWNGDSVLESAIVEIEKIIERI